MILLRFPFLFCAYESFEFLTQSFGFFGVFGLQTAGNFGLQLLAAGFLFQIVMAEVSFINHLPESAAAHGADGSIVHKENGVGAIGDAVKVV